MKEQARTLRNNGYSYRQIANMLEIAKSTAHAWTSDVQLDQFARLRLSNTVKDARLRSGFTVGASKTMLLQEIDHRVDMFLDQMLLDTPWNKLLCAMIYWCEGAKSDTTLKFTNSDPNLSRTFIRLLRDSFRIDESKLRITIHLHEYHNESRERMFWSNVTRIPLTQFHRTYLKPNTGKQKRDNYRGCICINYYDSNISRELLSIAKLYMQRFQP